MDLRPSPSSGRYESSSSTKKPYLSKSVSDANSHNQSLASILNNPHAGKSDGWWWPTSSSLPVVPEFAPLNPLPKPGSDLTRTDFTPYIASFSDPFTRFHDIQTHTKSTLLLDDQNGENALVACLREVPSLYFKEDFQLEDGATFKSVTAENLVVQEKLSQYLDVVELHLVREISLRSSSFFEAQGQLEDLNSKIVEGCKRIRELKETIRLLDTNLVGPARKLQELNLKRSDLVALQSKLNLIIYVNQALSTLNLLVASADCAGALDVTDDLQHLLDGDELAGLHCFRHLRDELATSIDSINSILSAEFMRITIQEAGNMDAAITSKFKARATIAINGEGHEAKLDEEETSNFRDRLLPFVIGLLRTAKLPAVLRIYRDTLTADMKTAIKTSVEELLRVLCAQPLDSDFVAGERVVDTDGGSSSLASRLRSLPPESFVQLLKAIFMIVQAHLARASEVKKTIEWIICHLDDHYAADSVAAAIALGAAAAETASEADGQITTFSQFSPPSNFSRGFSIHEKGNDVTTMSHLSRNFRADILRENTEAVFAACDAAHGRWAKILGVRAPIHPKLRLQEFLNIYNITQEFITATEKIGGRLGYSIRGTIQSQAKAFVDFQHDSRMAKLKAILDQENWAEIDVPDEFQTIVTSLFCPKSGTTGHGDDDSAVTATSQTEVVQSSSDPSMVDAGVPNKSHNTEQSDSTSTPPDSTAQSNDTNSRRSNPRMLSFGGVSYHMVNCGLILVKMLSEYIDMNNSLTGLSSEVVHRVVDILKFFNTRTCQLVLGAGAMQVSGLKSITSKHLALTSQVISFTYTIIPEIKRILFLKVPETHKGLLMLEVDRVAQDYKLHRDEIHSKLVQIMRERLLVHLRSLPQIVESWNRQEDTDSQPSQYARSITKEVGLLQRVLSRTLHEVDVQAIFRQVVIIFHSQISEAFSRLDISSQQARQRTYRDVQHLLGCIRSLPSDSKSNPPNWGQLDEFLAQNFCAEASQ
ncbi:PREDICTED: vacuolar protein sorting-associated protein 54, chloroplastic-like [Nicotiana attenuata]|uniref:Vacuolar protein sorting-associated protein 54, chloroplastic n=1 Tax=Nicotiana attenuata TaxID=49451 RepID=A0A1J6IP31_NICAT|nr:PREDICTED: vacuolar protein sorting-associated protein 54, chloroplastic-like [Nicotiana attenuata]OIT06622.1 vacuolar protein sorting-associated protein 54, chloroplastic [Nicotiana attenuata]